MTFHWCYLLGHWWADLLPDAPFVCCVFCPEIKMRVDKQAADQQTVDRKDNHK